MLTHHFATVWIIKKNHQLKFSLPPKICEVGCRYSLLGYACWSTCQLGCWPSQDSKYEHCQIDWEPVGGQSKTIKIWESAQLNISEIQIGFCGATILLLIFVYLLKSSHLPIPLSRSDQRLSTLTPMQSHEPVLRSLRTMAVALTTATQQLQNQINFASNVWWNLTYCNRIQRLQNP